MFKPSIGWDQVGFNNRAPIVEFETYTQTPGNSQAFILREEDIDPLPAVS